MLQIARRWAKPQGERVQVPTLKFLQTVPDWPDCGAGAGLATDRGPPPVLVRPLPEGVLLPPGVLRLDPFPAGGALPKEEDERVEAETVAAMVPSCRSSASVLRRHIRRRHFFSTSVFQYAVA